MKRVIASVLAALSFNVVALDAATVLMPSPLSLVLAYNTYVKDSKKVYYIRVQSQARDFEQAKKQSFRLASEQVAGTVVLSESELRNSKLTRDEIITYSSGLIDEYKIIDRVDGPGYVKLTMDVWITESVMAQRLLAKSVTDKKINGDSLSVRLGSILEEQQRGDDIFRAILRDYPKRAYVVKLTSSTTELDHNRNVNINVKWELAWDQRFTNAFYEAAKSTGQIACVTWNCPRVDSRIQGFTYSDTVKSRMIEEYFSTTGATVMVELLDIHGRSLATTCDTLHGFGQNFSMLISGPNWINLNSEQKIKGGAILSVGQNTAKLANLDTIQVQVVPNRQCRTVYNP